MLASPIVHAMSFLYWLSLIVGGGLLALSFVGDATGHDTDAGSDHAHSGDWSQILSLRNATYFLFGFGATGVLLRMFWGDRYTLMTTLAALAAGLIAWLVSGAAFTYLQRTDVGHMHGDKWLVGRTAEVLIPLSRESTGKISVTRAGQTQDLLAKPHDEEETDPSSWRSVMVVEVRDGIALVTPSPEEPGTSNIEE
jgi:hypothetical protein